MKKTLYKIFAVCLPVLLFSACEKEGTLVTTSGGTQPTFAASSTDIMLDDDIAEEEAVTFTWTAPDYGFNAAVSYSLQFAPQDGSFADALTENAGTELSKTYSVVQFNNLASQMGIVLGESAELQVRLKADVSDSMPSLYSEPVLFTVQTYSNYPDQLYVPGSYQGWNPAAAPQLSTSGNSGLFQGFINFPDAQTEFKFTPEPDWDEAYGDAGDGTSGDLSTAGGNMKVSGAGYYLVKADLVANSWSVTNTDWGLIGSSTPDQWNSDQDMTYDATAGVWTITLPLTAGEIKFRANDDWAINYGDNGADGSLEAGGTNIMVNEAGTYTVTLNLSDYTYSVVKQ